MGAAAAPVSLSVMLDRFLATGGMNDHERSVAQRRHYLEYDFGPGGTGAAPPPEIGVLRRTNVGRGGAGDPSNPRVFAHGGLAGLSGYPPGDPIADAFTTPIFVLPLDVELNLQAVLRASVRTPSSPCPPT